MKLEGVKVLIEQSVKDLDKALTERVKYSKKALCLKRKHEKSSDSENDSVSQLSRT